ncbi:ATP-binding cassette domain-containing protein [Pseudonocardiaceae bacterium YIM PH 21723]|nr:ATP-binding cassette domain-containing protein [Pseudonocardiaceae bacterium YIM PH 21723]
MGGRTKPAVYAEGLRKRFGETLALDGIDLAVQPGTVFGLLGPNGAGKTTTVRVLTTLLKPDAGEASVAGFDVLRDPQQVRANVGLTGQYAAVDELLTGFENLVMVGRLSRMTRRDARRRADELLARFQLSDAAGKLAKTYSGGMRRRLDLAASLMVSPPVLVLDEPTTGLDPRSRLGLWTTIEDLVAEGTTVLLTTQYLEEADRLADRIAVIDRGRVIAEGTPSELKRQVGGSEIDLELGEELTEAQVVSAAELVERTLGKQVSTDLATRRLSAPADGVKALRLVLQELEDAGYEVVDAAVRRPSLDQVFLQLTGHSADDEGEK